MERDAGTEARGCGGQSSGFHGVILRLVVGRKSWGCRLLLLLLLLLRADGNVD